MNEYGIAYCFDLDDTLIKSDASVKVMVGNRLVKSLSPQTYNTYKLKHYESFNFSEFQDPNFIYDSVKWKMWPLLEKINNKINLGSKDKIFILTARSPIVRDDIYKFLQLNGINTIKLYNIYCVGDQDLPVATLKKNVLLKITNSFQKTYFFDDDKKNIQLANEIVGLQAKLVESNFEYINKIEYMKKLVRESLNEMSVDGSPSYIYKRAKDSYGKATMALTIFSEDWHKIEHLFDEAGRPIDDTVKRIKTSNGWIWDLYVQSYNSGKSHRIYGVSGDYTFGLAPTYYRGAYAGNIRSAKEVFDKFIEMYLK